MYLCLIVSEQEFIFFILAAKELINFVFWRSELIIGFVHIHRPTSSSLDSFARNQLELLDLEQGICYWYQICDPNYPYATKSFSKCYH